MRFVFYYTVVLRLWYEVVFLSIIVLLHGTVLENYLLLVRITTVVTLQYWSTGTFFFVLQAHVPGVAVPHRSTSQICMHTTVHTYFWMQCTTSLRDRHLNWHTSCNASTVCRRLIASQQQLWTANTPPNELFWQNSCSFAVADVDESDFRLRPTYEVDLLHHLQRRSVLA